MQELTTYTQTFRVKDTDCDLNGYLMPGAFLRMVQQLSTDHCEAIGLNQETDILHLCGRFKHYHPVSQVLTSYIQDIHPEEVYMDIRKYYPYIPSDLPFDIQSLLICE